MIKLSKRLDAAVSLVPEGFAALDVGCDHGYTSIALLQSGKSPAAVASDVRKGPLAAAAANIETFGLSGKIKTVLADGIPENIAGLLPEDVPAALVITGMGGLLIRDILERAKERIIRFDAMVLSPQSDLDAVRKALSGFGFYIRDELCLTEDGKFYVMILAERGSAKPLSDAEALYGPVLLRKKDPVLYEELLKQLSVREKIREQLIANPSGKTAERLTVIEKEEALLNEALGYYSRT